MPGWLIALAEFFLKLWKERGPSTQEKLGASEQQVADLEKTNEQVREAVQARNTVAAVDAQSSPEQLRKLEQSDPDCRDCNTK